MVRNAYQGIGTEYETLLRAFDKENAAFAQSVGKDRAVRTYRKYLTVRKYVAEFIKLQYKRSDMSMNELTEEFIRDFCLYFDAHFIFITFRSRGVFMFDELFKSRWMPLLLFYHEFLSVLDIDTLGESFCGAARPGAKSGRCSA